MNALRNTLFRSPSARMFSSSRSLSIIAFVVLFVSVISFPAFSEATRSESLPGEHEVSNDPNSEWEEMWETNIEEWTVRGVRERQNGNFYCQAFLGSTSAKSMLLISVGVNPPIIEEVDFETAIVIQTEIYSFKTKPLAWKNNETVYKTFAPTQFDGRPEVRTMFFVRAPEAGLEQATLIGILGLSEDHPHKSKDLFEHLYWLYELRTGAHTLNLKLNLTRAMVPETVIETYRVVGFQDVEAFCDSFVTLPP